MTRQPWIADVLADAFRGVKGFQFEVYAGFSTRGSETFAPIGLTNHHTGGGGYDNLLRYMATGSSISPLCNWATSRPVNGIVRITAISAGRANHAGRGGAGRGGTSWIPTDGGNRLTLGGEHQNDGGQAWPDQQLEAIARGSAKLLQRLKQDESRTALHKTYAPGRKPDMHTVTLPQHQASIRHFLLGGGGSPAPAPAPAPSVIEEEPVLTIGAAGPAVAFFQECLRAEALAQDPPRPWGKDVSVDGQFGQHTQQAVDQFQRGAGLPATGSIDGVTAAVLTHFAPYWA